MKCLRKLFIIVLLFTLLDQLFADPCFTVDWSSIEHNLNTIELNLKELQTNNSYLQLQLTDAGNLLSEQKNYLAAQSIQLENLESSLKKSERTTRIWKYSFLTVTTICIVETAILVAQRAK